MKKLLVICGPTSTGKTSLALSLAKKYSGELVSADSRQVYKGMDIGTGKDLPKNSKLQMLNLPAGKAGGKLGLGKMGIGFYLMQGIKLWGYDLADPKKGFSVAQYIKVARAVVDNIWSRDKLPILVGGTGLYIKGVVDGIPTAAVKPKPRLRKSLAEKKVDELYEILANMDPVKAASLNMSDKKNPRRVIRAIEVALQKSKIKDRNSRLDASSLFIGLKASKSYLDMIIDRRVDKRVETGIVGEIKILISRGVSWKHQAMDSLGYSQWESYFKDPNEISKGRAVEKWKAEEQSYAKRQMTWFKKDKRINWFDISSRSYKKSVEKLVKKWYISANRKA